MLADPIKTYTYKDYLTYDENERIEIIEGELKWGINYYVQR